MITFLKILFFSKSVWLAASPIDIEGQHTFQLEEPVAAITSGAYLEIEATNLFGTALEVSDFQAVRERLPDSSIKATLVAENGDIVELRFHGNISKVGNEIWIPLRTTNGVPTGLRFYRVDVYSNVRIEKSRVRWNNCRI
ncbi:MAG: hypothetical protein R3217_09215 [Gammaproteobacteria bacterium]|nr:hypothetical protein [Gammaproteobacteria bacterium]